MADPNESLSPCGAYDPSAEGFDADAHLDAEEAIRVMVALMGALGWGTLPSERNVVAQEGKSGPTGEQTEIEPVD